MSFNRHDLSHSTASQRLPARRSRTTGHVRRITWLVPSLDVTRRLTTPPWWWRSRLNRVTATTLKRLQSRRCPWDVLDDEMSDEMTNGDDHHPADTWYQLHPPAPNVVCTPNTDKCIVIHTAVADTPVHPRQAREIRACLVLTLTNKSVEGWMRNKIKQ